MLIVFVEVDSADTNPGAKNENTSVKISKLVKNLLNLLLFDNTFPLSLSHLHFVTSTNPSIKSLPFNPLNGNNMKQPKCYYSLNIL